MVVPVLLSSLLVGPFLFTSSEEKQQVYGGWDAVATREGSGFGPRELSFSAS